MYLNIFFASVALSLFFMNRKRIADLYNSLASASELQETINVGIEEKARSTFKEASYKPLQAVKESEFRKHLLTKMPLHRADYFSSLKITDNNFSSLPDDIQKAYIAVFGLSPVGVDQGLESEADAKFKRLLLVSGLYSRLDIQNYLKTIKSDVTSVSSFPNDVQVAYYKAFA